MADALIQLNDSWRIADDPPQWVLEKRVREPQPGKSSGWREQKMHPRHRPSVEAHRRDVRHCGLRGDRDHPIMAPGLHVVEVSRNAAWRWPRNRPTQRDLGFGGVRPPKNT